MKPDYPERHKHKFGFTPYEIKVLKDAGIEDFTVRWPIAKSGYKTAMFECRIPDWMEDIVTRLFNYADLSVVELIIKMDPNAHNSTLNIPE